MHAPKVGYALVNNTTSTLRDGPVGFFGLVANAPATVTVYDNNAASGNVLYTKTLSAGEVVSFGGIAIAANRGLTVVSNASVNVLYG